jgi:hypothetical protein
LILWKIKNTRID